MNTVSYEQEGLVQFVIDSVYALAYAIHNMLADECDTNGYFKNCTSINNLDKERLLHYIRNVSFTGIYIINHVVSNKRSLVD